MENNEEREKYNEQIEQITNIFSLSSKKSSIVFDLKIKDKNASAHMSIIELKGDKKEFPTMNFTYDDYFYDNFIKELISEIKSNQKIAVCDVVNLDNDDLYTLRMISENRDLFTIDGLEKQKAYDLLKVDKKQEPNPILIKTDMGVGNILYLFIMTSIFIVISVITIVFFR